MSGTNGESDRANEVPVTERPARDGFKRIITIDANEKGNWELNFIVPPDAVLLFLQKIQHSILSGQFKLNQPESKIIKPTPGEIRGAS